MISELVCRLTMTVPFHLRLHKFPFDTQLFSLLIESCEYDIFPIPSFRHSNLPRVSIAAHVGKHCLRAFACEVMQKGLVNVKT